jgi:Na+/H+-dicarboxylate symporter
MESGQTRATGAPAGSAAAVGLACASVVGFGLALAAERPTTAYALLLGGLALLIFRTQTSPNLLIAGASVSGAALGSWEGSHIEDIRVVGQLFIALLKMLVAPMILLSITTGIAGMANARDFGRIGSRTLWFYVGTMTLAVGTGLLFVNVFQPGVGSKLLETEFFTDALRRAGTPAEAPELSLGASLAKMIKDMFMNPVSALAQGRILPIVAFAVLLGLALVQIGERGRPLVEVIAAGNAAVMQMIGWFVKLAPIGVFALLGHLVATAGIAQLAEHLGLFIAVVFGATLVHAGITLPLIVRTFGRMSPLTFLRGIQPALWVSFSTSSSAATLPVTTKCVEEELGVPREVSSFVLPLGATVNMDGTALYEAIAAIFIANIYGIELSLGSQLVVFLISMVSAIGAPGIPSAGMVTMVVVLESVGLPLEAVALLLTIDRLLDTVRTMANVEGDAAVALCVSRERVTPPV